MSRIAPALLVCLLAVSGPARADDAFPPLDQRLGKTITVVEKNYPTEKAVITQVWRMSDGTPVMQAKTTTSNVQLTLVENMAAKSVTERIKVLRWTNGVRPEGCPMPPAMAAAPAKTAAPVKATEVAKTTSTAKTTEVVKTTAPAKTTTPVTQAQYSKPAGQTAATAKKTSDNVETPKSEKVVTTDGGLMPVLPKKEVVTAAPKEVVPAAPAVMNKPPVAPTVLPSATKPIKTDVAMPAPAAVKTTPVQTPAKTTTTVVVKQAAPAPAVIKTPASTMPMQTTVVTTHPTTTAPVATNQRELIGGCEVITVTENNVTRKYKVLGTARDKYGVMTQRCQALDNNEIVTLNCDNCRPIAPVVYSQPASPPVVVCTPAPVKCEPAKVVCAPAPVKVDVKPCEPAKVVCAPPVKVECKPCEPVKVACEPVKPCAPVAKACDPCANAKGCDTCCTTKACDPCHGRGLGKGDCGSFCARESLFDRSCRLGHRHHNYHCEVNVPVPGVHLSAYNGMPGGPPPQPMIPAFSTMNSSSVRAYMTAPELVPMVALNRPFGDNVNIQIEAGMHQMNPGNGYAVANTLHLINVLHQSKENENRQWAAQRLEQATLPSVRPYVEDALLTAAQTDRDPMVKVAAIRTLASLKSTRQEMVAMLSQASVDADPRIKEAANEAINMLTKGQNVQQAGYTK